jgi:NodT family efflux transporter outer membrane factor (OMF) lipoprotein
MRTRVIAAIALAASLAGCAAAPHPNASQVALPSQYSAAGPLPEAPTADGVAQHFAQGTRPTPRWWQAYQSEALNALVEEGLAQSPSLASAQATLKATHEALRVQIGDNLYPSVDLGFAPSRQRALTIPNLPQETFLYNVFALEAQASYRFDFFGATLYADRALALQVDQQSFQFDATRRALAANIVIATINAATLNEDLDATETLVSLAEQYAQQLAARERLGGVSHDEALVAEQNAATLAATLPALRAQLLAVRHAQAVLLGRSPDQAPAPLPLATLHLPEEVPVSVPSDLLHQRPDILAAEAGVRSAANQAGAAAALLYPSLALSAGYGRGGFDWSTFTSPAGAIWSVGATLSQPLFHGGALRARKRQYADLYDAAQSAYRQTVLAAFENVADTLASLDEDANALAQSSRAADAALRTEADAQARFRLGALPWSATLSAGQQYQNARVALVRARAARLADTASLFQAMGERPSVARGGPLRE